MPRLHPVRRLRPPRPPPPCRDHCAGRWDLSNLNPATTAPLTADEQAFSIPVSAVTSQIASMAANGGIPADNAAAVGSP